MASWKISLKRAMQLISLHWSKCFDGLPPGVAAQLMQSWNLPSRLAAVFADIWAWTHQKRWVSWAGCTHPDPLNTATSVPQGDPFGLFAAMLWGTCGLTKVESRMPAHMSVKTTLYADDRSITSKDQLALVARKRSWFAWSQSVGLKENESTVAVVATRWRVANVLRILVLQSSSRTPCECWGLTRLRVHFSSRRMKPRGSTNAFALFGSSHPVGFLFKLFIWPWLATSCGR